MYIICCTSERVLLSSERSRCYITVRKCFDSSPTLSTIDYILLSAFVVHLFFCKLFILIVMKSVLQYFIKDESSTDHLISFPEVLHEHFSSSPRWWFLKQCSTNFRRKPVGNLLFSGWKLPQNAQNPRDKSCDRIRLTFTTGSDQFQIKLAKSSH